MIEDPYDEERGASLLEWDAIDKRHVMDQAEQLEWLEVMPAAVIKAKLLVAVKEFPTSEDIYALIKEIIS